MDRNDKDLTKEIVEEYKGVIHAKITKNTLKSNEPYKVSFEDLIQPGMIELYKSIQPLNKDELHQKIVVEREIISALKSEKRKDPNC